MIILGKIIFSLINFVSSETSELPILKEDLLYTRDHRSYLQEFESLRKYFIFPKEEPFEYTTNLKENCKDLLVNLNNSLMNDDGAKALRRMFRYNCLLNAKELHKLKNSQDDEKIANNIDNFLRDRVYEFSYSDFVKKIKEVNKSSESMVRALRTFNYFNTVITRIISPDIKHAILPTSSLLEAFFSDLNDSNFIVSEEKPEKTETSTSPANKEKTLQKVLEIYITDLNVILKNLEDQKSSKVIPSLLESLKKCEDNLSNLSSKLTISDASNKELYFKKLTIASLVIARLEMIRLILDTSMHNYDAMMTVVLRYLNSHFLFSFSNFALNSTLNNFVNENISKPDKSLKSNEFKLLLEFIEDDIVWQFGSSGIIRLDDSIFRQIIEKLSPQKQENTTSDYVKNLIIGFMNPSKLLNFGDESFEKEKNFALNYLQKIEDKFSSDPNYASAEEMKSTGLKKQFYRLKYYNLILEQIDVRKPETGNEFLSDTSIINFKKLLDLIINEKLTPENDVMYSTLKSLILKLDDALQNRKPDQKLYEKLSTLKFQNLLDKRKKLLNTDDYVALLLYESQPRSSIFQYLSKYTNYVFWMLFVLNFGLILYIIKTRNDFNESHDITSSRSKAI